MQFFNWKDYGYDMFIGTAKAPKNPLDKDEMRRQNKYYYELRKAKTNVQNKTKICMATKESMEA